MFNVYSGVKGTVRFKTGFLRQDKMQATTGACRRFFRGNARWFCPWQAAWFRRVQAPVSTSSPPPAGKPPARRRCGWLCACSAVLVLLAGVWAAGAFFPVKSADNWQLSFQGDRLAEQPANHALLARLQQLLPYYPPGNNPELQFQFHRQRDLPRRWANVRQYLPRLYDYQAQLYQSPEQDKLSIVLAERDAPYRRCPGSIQVSDPALPLAPNGLRLHGSARLALSAAARLTVSAPEHMPFLLVRYDPVRQDFTDISRQVNQPFAPKLSDTPVSLYYLTPAAGQTKAEVLAALQQQMMPNQPVYRNKEAGLSAIGADEIRIVIDNDRTGRQCEIVLTMFNPGEYQ